MSLAQIPQLTTAQLTGFLKDAAGNAVPGSALTSATLTLEDLNTGQIINGRNEQNVLQANNVTIDGTGFLTWAVQPADNPIITPTQRIEVHVATFELFWPAGRLNFEIEIQVVNLGLSD